MCAFLSSCVPRKTPTYGAAFGCSLGSLWGDASAEKRCAVECRSRPNTLKWNACMRHGVRVCADEVLAARSTARCVESFRIQYRLMCIRCDNVKINVSALHSELYSFLLANSL